MTQLFPLLGSPVCGPHPGGEDPYRDLIEKGQTLCNYLAVRDPVNEIPDVILALGSDFEEIAYQTATLALILKPKAVLCAGGRGRHTPAGWASEAEKFSEILRSQGVAAEKILVENKSTNTGENLRFAKRILEANGLEPASLLITLYPLLQLRATLTAHKEWASGVTLRSWAAFIPNLSLPLPTWPLSLWRRRLLWESVGEIYRLLEYQKPDKGFIQAIEIPDDIRAAALETGTALLQDASIPPEQIENLKTMLAGLERAPSAT